MTRKTARLVFGMGLAAGILAAQDVVTVSPANYKVEIENNWVRVLRARLGPHATAPMHGHPASVVVYLTDLHERVTSADGATEDVTHKAGDVVFREAARHAEENVSGEALEAIVV